MPVLHVRSMGYPTHGGKVHLPRPLIRLIQGTNVSPPIRSFIDTGSYLTLAHEDVALTALKLSRQQLESGSSTYIKGIGGVRTPVFQHLVDIELGTNDPNAVVVAKVPVYFGALALPFDFKVDVLLGQLGALNHFIFVQRSPAKDPYFSCIT